MTLSRDGGILLDGLYTLKSDAEVVVTLTEAGDYQGIVSIPASGAVEPFEPGPLDCNDSETVATGQSHGELEVKAITTDRECGTAESNGTDTIGQ